MLVSQIFGRDWAGRTRFAPGVVFFNLHQRESYGGLLSAGPILLFVLAAVIATGCQPTVRTDAPPADPVLPENANTTGGPKALLSDNDSKPHSLAELLLDPADLELAKIDDERNGEPTENDQSASNATETETKSPTAESPDNQDSAAPRETERDPANHLKDDKFTPSLPAMTTDVTDGTGMRKLQGRYVTIITDMPSSAEVNELPLVFDRAVEQWGRYFRIPRDDYDRFAMIGFVMQSKERFMQRGYLPSDLPPFLHGYQRGDNFWVYGDQPSGYYRRHLVLHEGTHGFMQAMLGGTGAPWYREGLADFLATHLWKENRLTLGYMPKSRDEVPYWGRIKVIKESFANGRALMIQEVMRLETREYMKVDAYAWSWAAVAMLDSHPLFQRSFRALSKSAKDNTIRFTRNFEQQVFNELREMDESWQVFVANIEYGYDFDRFAVVRAPGRAIPSSGAVATIKADRGWQSTGYRLEAGRRYLISATGRYTVQSTPEEWSSEPGGITLRYYKGQPLGRLLGNVRLDRALPGLANLVSPLSIGQGRFVQPSGGGTLYLRINDSAAELSDNRGDLTVRILPR